MIDRQTLLLAALAGAGAFILSELAMSALDRRREGGGEASEGLEERRAKAIWRIEESRAAEPEPDYGYERIVPDEKPDILSMVHENVFDKEEPEEEETEAVEVGDALEEIGKTKWGTEALAFGDDGLPVFGDEHWDAEEAASVELISQEEYTGDMWPTYDRDQAIWYPRDGDKVLADQEFNLMEVVDTVGPTALLTMLKHPGSLVYVRNDGLCKCYELWENDVDFEEALVDAGYDVGVRLG